MSSSSSKVSVILVTFNSLPALRDSLTTLKERCREIPCELIVVDNGSTDETVNEVRRIAPEATVINSQTNLGFAAACNLGVEHAGGEYVLFHNPDVMLDHGALDVFVSQFEQIDRPGAASGRMRFPDGSFQATCRNFPRLGNLVFSRGSFLSRLGGSRAAYTLADYPDITEVPAVAGTLMLIRRRLFQEMGGFDTRFFMYMEDTDLCFRLSQAGFRNFYIPSAGGVHLWGEGSTAGRVRRAFYHHRSVWKYFLKHFPGAVSLLILPLILGANFVMTALFPARQKAR